MRAPPRPTPIASPSAGRRPAAPPPRAPAPFAALVLVAVAHYWRWGYRFGESDHDELLPLVLRLTDGGLFGRDGYVLTQEGGVNIRTAFAWTLRALSFVLPLEAAVALVHAVVLLATLYGAYRLAQTFGADRLGALAGTFAAAVLVRAWTLGGNALAPGLLAPEPIAWALALPAVRLFVEGKRLPTALLLGVAAWFQALVGVLTAGALGLVALMEAARGPDRARELLGAATFGAAFALASALVVVPILITPPAEVVPEVSTFDALARLRVPHHYLPSAFGAGAYARFAAVVAMGGFGAWMLHRRGRLRHGAFVGRLLAAVALFGLVGALCTEVVPVIAVAQLQVFKLTVLATTVLALLAGAAFAAALPERVRVRAERALDARWMWALALGGAALTAALVAAGVGRPARLYGPRVHAASDLAAAERWAGANTSEGALFAVPPSNTTFRVTARRSVVINFKPTPYQPEAIHVWLARLRDVAPAPLPRRGGFAWLPALDSAYHANDAARWRRLRARYGVDYALVASERTRLPFPVAYRNAGWTVYALGVPPPP